jgi:antitoxin StbD
LIGREAYRIGTGPEFASCLKDAEYGAIFVADIIKGSAMDPIYADYSISMTEFKKNPAQVLRAAGEKPVAVLNHNRPAFYMLTPKLFEALVEELSDRQLAELVRQRLARKDTAIEVDIDRI